LRRDRAEAIVRDEHKGTAKFEKAFPQNFEGGDVEIVSRFVEKEHVGGLEHELSDQYSSAFTAREAAHGAIEIFAGKEKTRRPASDVDHAILINNSSHCPGRGRALAKYPDQDGGFDRSRPRAMRRPF